MKKLLGCFLCVVLLVFGVAASVQALSFDLNYGKVNPPDTTFGIVPSFGTISIIDNGDDVDISVSLTGGTTGPQFLYFNLDETNDYGTLSVTNATAVLPTPLGTTFDTQKMDGYNVGNFDLQITTDANPNDTSWSGTLSSTINTLDLDPSMFDINENGLLAGIHINHYAPDPSDGNSLYGGSKSVPDPSVMLLLGSSFLGLAVVGRKIKTS